MWCSAHKNDNNIDQDKHKDKNSIYSKVFCQALERIGYVKKFNIPNEDKATSSTNSNSNPRVNENIKKTTYPATLDDKVYWLTSLMVTAINKSWKPDKPKGLDEEKLEQLPAISIGDDGLFNFQCLENIIKKHTGDLKVHSEALELVDPSDQGEASRDLLFRVSNVEIELQGARLFVINSLQKAPQLKDVLLRVFKNTEKGNLLSNKLFGCSVKELPDKIASIELASASAAVTNRQAL